MVFEFWALDRKIKQNTPKMTRVTRLMSRVIKEDIIKNECVRGCISIMNKSRLG